MELFTEQDMRMIRVLDNLSKVTDGLTDYALWLYDEWTKVSDDPMPFFEVHEQEAGDGRSVCSLVLVLRRIEVNTSDLDGHRVPWWSPYQGGQAT